MIKEEDTEEWKKPLVRGSCRSAHLCASWAHCVSLSGAAQSTHVHMCPHVSSRVLTCPSSGRTNNRSQRRASFRSSARP
uniref:Uncharacterized protein n=1 Tax=Knipowitschia caucasica TaxID=637954 RepID=A0AAV2K604_KNICA